MDGSGPPRANAAQLAQRNIKALKGGRAGARPRAAPVQSPNPSFGQPQSAQPFQFQPPNGGSNNNGGFGFSFSGGNVTNPFANGNGQQLSANDERRDPAEERDNKRRSSSGRDGNSTPLFAPMPQGPANAFGVAQSTSGATQNGGIFSAGSEQSAGMSIDQRQASTIFGGFGKSQNQPSSSIFNPGPLSSQPSTGFTFSFGAPSQPSQPASTPFSFGQTSSQPKSAGFQFGATTATEAPASNLFGTSQPPSTNLFGTSSQTPSSNNFSNTFGQNAASPTPPSNLFGSTTQPQSSNLFSSSTATASNPFGSKETSPAPSTKTPNLFGSNPQSPSSSLFTNSTLASNNIFEKKPDLTPAPQAATQNPFGSVSQPPTSSIFSASASSTSNLFSSKALTPVPVANGNDTVSQDQQSKPFLSGLFGQQSQQQTPGAVKTSLFGNLHQPSAAPSPLFAEEKSEPSSSLFGHLNQSSSASGGTNKPSEQSAFSNSLFANTSKQASSDLFGNLNKPVDQAVTDPKPKSTFLFGTSTTQNPPSPIFGQQAPSNGLFQSSNVSATAASPAPTSSAPVLEAAQPSVPLFSFGSSQATPPPPPQPGKATLFSPMKPMEAPSSASDPPPTGMFPSIQNQASQQTPQGMSSTATLEKTTEGESIAAAVQRLEEADPLEAPKHDGTSFADLGIAKQITDEYMKDLVPVGFTDEQRKDFYCAYRIRALNRAMAVYFGGLQTASDPTGAMKFYFIQRKSLMEEVKVRNAKKAGGGVPETGRTEATPSQPLKQTARSRSRSPTRSTLSPVKQQQASVSAPSRVNGNTVAQPSDMPLASVPALLPPQHSAAPSSAKGKRKAEDDLDKDNADQINKRPMRKIATPSSNGSSESSSGGSTTSNIFKNILDSPSKSPEKSPPKKTASLPGTSSAPANDTPKANPFGSLYVPKSPSKTDAPPTPNQQVETPKVTNGFTPSSTNVFESNLIEVAKPSGFTSSLSTNAASGIGSSAAQGSKGFQMPGFSSGGSVNFAAQFGQQSVDSEQEEMKKAMDNDFDSEEEDAEEWKARWKKERRERIAKFEAAASAKPTFTFGANKITEVPAESSQPSKPLFAFGSTTPKKPAGPATESTQPSKQLFALSAPSHTQNTGLLSPANISRASSASPVPSLTGSVLDGHAAGKPVTFGNNIFGHLSGGDSGKSDDADDENGDEADSESDAEIDGDSENKDPNYTPGQDSIPGTPGTPVEETGAGIASAKKSNLFNFPPAKSGSVFGASPSGTSTPGGSLFGRITRDASAKPALAASSEEKENTQPTPSGLFAALNKSQNTPADQTWKIDSPIKFGSATPNNESKAPTPTFNVTAATPTKTGSPAGLFSNLNSSSGPTSAPFSNLFGNSITPKPTAAPSVGFNFGGGSNTSSLFPSAATSRATSPGATTDGDSATEDPDAEKHVQISLTAGGAEEEDEESQFEVRAKVLLYCQKEGGGASAWEAKGLGPLRVLKHKETEATRVLLRAEPRGNVVLNKGILGNVKYEAAGKTVKFVAANETGKGLETWLIQVKTEALAKELAEALEANKAS